MAMVREKRTDIRRKAARQHLDQVLIYEIGAQSHERDTPFALADVTLIGGAPLPTGQFKVAGVGQAFLVDVRNGYPTPPPRRLRILTVWVAALAPSAGKGPCANRPPQRLLQR